MRRLRKADHTPRGTVVWQLLLPALLIVLIAILACRTHRARTGLIPPTRALEALHAVDAAQELYQDSTGVYASSLEQLRRGELLGREADIDRVEIVGAGDTSWAARVRSGFMYGGKQVCAIYVGPHPEWIPQSVAQGNQRCFRQ